MADAGPVWVWPQRLFTGAGREKGADAQVHTHRQTDREKERKREREKVIEEGNRYIHTEGECDRITERERLNEGRCTEREEEDTERD